MEALIALLLVAALLSYGDGKGKQPNDWSVGRNADGSHYVYSPSTGEVVYECETKAEAERYAENLRRK